MIREVLLIIDIIGLGMLLGGAFRINSNEP